MSDYNNQYNQYGEQQPPPYGHQYGNTPPQPNYGQQQPYGQQPPYGGYGPQQPYGYGPQPPRRPSTNLVWAILTTLFCCLPFGIVSIVYAAKVDSLWSQGLYDEAQSASKKAATWAIVSAVSSAVIAVLYFIFYVIAMNL